MSYQAVNPFNETLINEFSNASTTDIENALTNGHEFYLASKSQTPNQREQLLTQLADEFENNSEHYAKLLSTNMGKLIGQARTEVKNNVAIARYYAKHGAEFIKPKTFPSVDKSNAYVLYQATGIVLAVEPWNFPYTQVMRVVAPNFILGNAVILKHAGIVPECAQAFEEACHNAGWPVGAFKNLFLDYDQVDAVIADPRVQGVALTGSDGAGRTVAASAGKYLKQSSMELGGTDVFVVLADADIPRAVKEAAQARLTNAGQVCTAGKRYLVAADIYDEFLAQLKVEFATYKLGDPLDEATTLAPLSSKAAQKKLREQTEQVIAGGAQVLYGELTDTNQPGAGFTPMILTGMTPDNPMYDTELFGPVAQIYKVADDDEIVALANNSEHGLGGAIYATDIAHARRLASRIETGQISINRRMASHSEVPFGGIKDSGYGRELSHYGIEVFANVKAITYND
ncbi:NAD-dependent succinate-semialdehyde dehydrogenase [Periweissella fabaria]|uniref:Succinate-semialdehyde dehydrogenase [NADP(+)] 1 n=1 Tax=Periweissella fabaria TaxID=546157 RepID=A0ABM8Z430_9LACO|nr:NAD-dependent succinate-semialdehyde dehydrogenase [Periweissella fabaria]MCM0597368.1 NAD-dependent succinate-semialdehyde dehydrogenase [Periweissella fabaria]CAH0416126.1 Succinate-semialdehyde dehydrogenase [NADP(+)] 1 [Periweissella fabaria]